jgi:CheY-like chemotaxis protein
MTRAAARRTQGGPGQRSAPAIAVAGSPASSGVAPALAGTAAALATPPPPPAPVPPPRSPARTATPSPATTPAASAEPHASVAAETVNATVPPVPIALPPPNATLPPTPAALVGVGRARREAAPPTAAPIEQVLHEIQALRELQERMLAMLQDALAAPVARASADDEGTGLSPIRAPRRKGVVLVDDDPATREAAVRELQQADVPVRAFADGNDALRAIAEDKPDLVALELGVSGHMAGKDVINVIKATMEWVDVPIILWTREPVASQKEARVVHGADEVVPKSAGAAALVARVITVFRRG